MRHQRRCWPRSPGSIANLHAAALALPTLGGDGSITLVTAGTAQSALPEPPGWPPSTAPSSWPCPSWPANWPPPPRQRRLPGAIETTWWDALPEDQRRTTLATFGQRAPADRNDTLDDMADAIAAFIESCFLTEVVLLCDDGPWLT